MSPRRNISNFNFHVLKVDIEERMEKTFARLLISRGRKRERIRDKKGGKSPEIQPITTGCVGQLPLARIDRAEPHSEGTKPVYA
jgi:hypothetical protein